MKYFQTHLCKQVALPIIKHTDQAIEPCYIVVARITNTQIIQEKIDAGIIKGVISTQENLKHFHGTDLVECENPTLFWAFLCYKNFDALPANRICVTGTNGKTSTSWFVYQILCGLSVSSLEGDRAILQTILWRSIFLKSISSFMRSMMARLGRFTSWGRWPSHSINSNANINVLLINSLGIFDTSGRISDTNNTTPDAEVIHKHAHAFAQKHPNGFLILETSSIAIEQNRVAYINPQVSIWTNFSHEHLDYHKTMDAYKEAKMALGKMSGKYFVHNSIEQNEYPKYGNEVTDIKQGEKLEFKINGIQTSCDVFGTFQAHNMLSAVTALKEFFPVEKVIEQIPNLQAPSGRMQKIAHNGKTVLVDNAHKPHALESALYAIKESSNERVFGRIFVVAGCGGDRDKQKRPIMGKIMHDIADIAIITSDNPRSENPETIAQEMKGDLNMLVILDRKQAISYAINAMQPGDILLIAGKGDEHYQIFADKTIEFSDIEVARQILHQTLYQKTLEER